MKSKFYVSSAEVEIGQLNSQSFANATQLFETHGAIWIENVFSREFVGSLATAYDESYTSLSPRKLAKKHAVVGDQRFMVTVKIKGPFNSPQLYANPILMPLLQQLLGSQLVISSFGSVVTFPGAADQPIHFDHPPLYEDEATCAGLPQHAITMVVPLVDIGPETGSTAIWEGSHKQIGSREKLAHLMENPTWEGSSCPLPKMGDVYLMDYRVIHGGMANRSEHPRPILYIVYSRPWFRDAYNFSDQPAVMISKKQLGKVPRQWRGLFP